MGANLHPRPHGAARRRSPALALRWFRDGEAGAVFCTVHSWQLGLTRRPTAWRPRLRDGRSAASRGTPPHRTDARARARDRRTHCPGCARCGGRASGSNRRRGSAALVAARRWRAGPGRHGEARRPGPGRATSLATGARSCPCGRSGQREELCGEIITRLAMRGNGAEHPSGRARRRRAARLPAPRLVLSWA
jgi:hypothetical protein